MRVKGSLLYINDLSVLTGILLNDCFVFTIMFINVLGVFECMFGPPDISCVLRT